MSFGIFVVEAGHGKIAIAPLPGRYSPLAEDIRQIADWRPAIVVSMTERHELERTGAQNMAAMLGDYDIEWAHFPIPDYGCPDAKGEAAWPVLSERLHNILSQEKRVLLHCAGGIGRSGAVALKLLVEQGETPETGLARLRAVRPGAVETAEQLAWASRSAGG